MHLVPVCYLTFGSCFLLLLSGFVYFLSVVAVPPSPCSMNDVAVALRHLSVDA